MIFLAILYNPLRLIEINGVVSIISALVMVVYVLTLGNLKSINRFQIIVGILILLLVSGGWFYQQNRITNERDNPYGSGRI